MKYLNKNIEEIGKKANEKSLLKGVDSYRLFANYNTGDTSSTNNMHYKKE